MANAYDAENREVGDDKGEPLWYATKSLSISYLRPTPLKHDFPILLQGTITETEVLFFSLLLIV